MLMGLLINMPANGSDLAGQIEQKVISTVLSNARQAYPGGHISVDTTPIDPRLKLSACETMDASPRGQNVHGRVHVAVSCLAPQPWRVFVTATVAVEVPVLVAARAVLRGQVLNSDDVTLAPRDLASVRGKALTELPSGVKYASRRNVSAGQVLSLAMLQQLPSVSRGDIVLLSADIGSARVSAKAEALENGQRGEQIRVRNLRSEKVVRAWVQGPGRVSSRRATQFSKNS